MSKPPPVILEYGSHRPEVSIWGWQLLACGILPFVLQFIIIYIEAVTGDPVNSLRELKAYHYWTGATVLSCLLWLAGVIAFWRRYPWVLFVACVSCFFVCWLGIWFLIDLNAHPASQYYWSLN